jgi:hypothetical protein
MRDDDAKQDESQDFFESCCKPELIVSRKRPSDLERNWAKNIHGLRTPPIHRAANESILAPFSWQVSIVLPEKSLARSCCHRNLRLETNDKRVHLILRATRSLMKFSRLSWYFTTVIFLSSLLITAPALADMDGVMMSGGKMMMMKAGQPATAMDHEVTMSDGTIVSIDGTVKPKDGRKFHLQNGEMIMMDGHFMKGGKATGMAP